MGTKGMNRLKPRQSVAVADWIEEQLPNHLDGWTYRDAAEAATTALGFKVTEGNLGHIVREEDLPWPAKRNARQAQAERVQALEDALESVRAELTELQGRVKDLEGVAVSMGAKPRAVAG